MTTKADKKPGKGARKKGATAPAKADEKKAAAKAREAERKAAAKAREAERKAAAKAKAQQKKDAAKARQDAAREKARAKEKAQREKAEAERLRKARPPGTPIPFEEGDELAGQRVYLRECIEDKKGKKHCATEPMVLVAAATPAPGKRARQVWAVREGATYIAPAGAVRGAAAASARYHAAEAGISEEGAACLDYSRSQAAGLPVAAGAYDECPALADASGGDTSFPALSNDYAAAHRMSRAPIAPVTPGPYYGGTRVFFDRAGRIRPSAPDLLRATVRPFRVREFDVDLVTFPAPVLDAVAQRNGLHPYWRSAAQAVAAVRAMQRDLGLHGDLQSAATQVLQRTGVWPLGQFLADDPAVLDAVRGGGTLANGPRVARRDPGFGLAHTKGLDSTLVSSHKTRDAAVDAMARKGFDRDGFDDHGGRGPYHVVDLADYDVVDVFGKNALRKRTTRRTAANGAHAVDAAGFFWKPGAGGPVTLANEGARVIQGEALVMPVRGMPWGIESYYRSALGRIGRIDPAVAPRDIEGERMRRVRMLDDTNVWVADRALRPFDAMDSYQRMQASVLADRVEKHLAEGGRVEFLNGKAIFHEPPVQMRGRARATMPNHHGRPEEHAAGDPLGVYMPEYEAPGWVPKPNAVFPNVVTYVWDQPELDWRFRLHDEWQEGRHPTGDVSMNGARRASLGLVRAVQWRGRTAREVVRKMREWYAAVRPEDLRTEAGRPWRPAGLATMPNHHGRSEEHAPHDMLGQYLPPVERWETRVVPDATGDVRESFWVHPQLRWRFSILWFVPEHGDAHERLSGAAVQFRPGALWPRDAVDVARGDASNVPPGYFEKAGQWAEEARGLAGGYDALRRWYAGIRREDLVPAPRHQGAGTLANGPAPNPRMPPLAEWDVKHIGNDRASPALRRVWAPAGIPVEFQVDTQEAIIDGAYRPDVRRGFVNFWEDVDGLPKVLKVVQGRDSAEVWALLRSWYGDMPPYQPPRYGRHPYDRSTYENKPPEGLPPGTPYFSRDAEKDMLIGRRVSGENFAGTVASRAVACDGEDGYLVGGHPVSRSRALNALRRQQVAAGEREAPPPRAAGPRAPRAPRAQSEQAVEVRATPRDERAQVVEVRPVVRDEPVVVEPTAAPLYGAGDCVQSPHGPARVWDVGTYTDAGWPYMLAPLSDEREAARFTAWESDLRPSEVCSQPEEAPPPPRLYGAGDCVASPRGAARVWDLGDYRPGEGWVYQLTERAGGPVFEALESELAPSGGCDLDAPGPGAPAQPRPRVAHLFLSGVQGGSLFVVLPVADPSDPAVPALSAAVEVAGLSPHDVFVGDVSLDPERAAAASLPQVVYAATFLAPPNAADERTVEYMTAELAARGIETVLYRDGGPGGDVAPVEFAPEGASFDAFAAMPASFDAPIALLPPPEPEAPPPPTPAPMTPGERRRANLERELQATRVYGLDARPHSGDLPRGWTSVTDGPTAARFRYGILTYDAPLPLDAIARYELIPVWRSGIEAYRAIEAAKPSLDREIELARQEIRDGADVAAVSRRASRAIMDSAEAAHREFGVGLMGGMSSDEILQSLKDVKGIPFVFGVPTVPFDEERVSRQQQETARWLMANEEMPGTVGRLYGAPGGEVILDRGGIAFAIAPDGDFVTLNPSRNLPDGSREQIPFDPASRPGLFRYNLDFVSDGQPFEPAPARFQRGDCVEGPRSGRGRIEDVAAWRPGVGWSYRLQGSTEAFPQYGMEAAEGCAPAMVGESLDSIFARTRRYGLRSRPAGYGTVPDGWERAEPAPPGLSDFFPYGVVVYPAALTPEAIDRYELTPLWDSKADALDAALAVQRPAAAREAWVGDVRQYAPREADKLLGYARDVARDLYEGNVYRLPAFGQFGRDEMADEVLRAAGLDALSRAPAPAPAPVLALVPAPTPTIDLPGLGERGANRLGVNLRDMDIPGDVDNAQARRVWLSMLRGELDEVVDEEFEQVARRAIGQLEYAEVLFAKRSWVRDIKASRERLEALYQERTGTLYAPARPSLPSPERKTGRDAGSEGSLRDKQAAEPAKYKVGQEVWSVPLRRTYRVSALVLVGRDYRYQLDGAPDRIHREDELEPNSIGGGVIQIVRDETPSNATTAAAREAELHAEKSDMEKALRAKMELAAAKSPVPIGGRVQFRAVNARGGTPRADLAGRHGEVVDMVFSTTHINNDPKTATATLADLKVRTDGGALIRVEPGAVEAEIDPPPRAVPDPRVDGTPHTPGNILQSARAAHNVIVEEDARLAEAARKGKRAKRSADAVKASNALPSYQRAWSAWSSTYPEEAQRLLLSPSDVIPVGSPALPSEGLVTQKFRGKVGVVEQVLTVPGMPMSRWTVGYLVRVPGKVDLVRGEWAQVTRPPESAAMPPRGDVAAAVDPGRTGAARSGSSIVVRFDRKPGVGTLQSLRSAGFVWRGREIGWQAQASAKTEALARSIDPSFT